MSYEVVNVDMQKKYILNDQFYGFIKFGIVGSFGFLVDLSFFYLFKGFIGIYFAKILSFIFAVMFTWVVNRNFTFKNKEKKFTLHVEFMKYSAVAVLGGIINYLAFYLVFNMSSFIEGHPFIAVAVGSVSGMFFNFINSKILIYK
ncbi:GtrA family protein [Pantoea eucalypti]|jgi:putative flippase GtrA|uniref:GtrA family protein n=1 Tax=Pantoea eucalypti TaxID=470933 RepID=UPI001C784FB3|nr:GtrA family protein [Pantoea eucalypti]QXG55813.1 GtrA family protein [Pantoea jilinensis]